MKLEIISYSIDESDSEQLPENSTLHVTAEFYSSEIKPLVKNQATSPKIPTPDPDDKVCFF